MAGDKISHFAAAKRSTVAISGRLEGNGCKSKRIASRVPNPLDLFSGRADLFLDGRHSNCKARAIQASITEVKLNQNTNRKKNTIMGTRSITHIYREADSKEPFVTIYRQFDGYPTGMGEDIKAALGGKTLVNGYSAPETQTNGMPCAAAMLVGALKEGKCGNVYLYPAGSSDCGEEFTYRLYPAGDRFRFVIDGIYDGPLHEFDSAKAEPDEEEAETPTPPVIAALPG